MILSCYCDLALLSLYSSILLLFSTENTCAETEQYCDMVEAGVMDPTKVVRFALQNAASVASLMLSTEAIIAEKPKKKDLPMTGGGGMGGMGGMNDMY